MTNLHTGTYRGVSFQHLSITQVEVLWATRCFWLMGTWKRCGWWMTCLPLSRWRPRDARSYFAADQQLTAVHHDGSIWLSEARSTSRG